MYNSTWNCRVTTIKAKGSAGVKPRTKFGEPVWQVFNMLTSTPFILNTWVDFTLSRRQLINNANTDVVADWEIQIFTHNVINGIIGKELGVGDQVQFDIDPRWFILANDIHDRGLFNSNVHHKFTLTRSDTP